MTADTMTTDNTHAPELDEARRALEGRLSGLETQMGRLMLPGGMSATERDALRRELGAADQAECRTRLNQEIGRAKQTLELLRARLVPETPPAPDPAQIAAAARAELEALRPLRARLAREVIVDGLAARVGLLEETEDKLRRLELEAERAEIAAGYTE